MFKALLCRTSFSCWIIEGLPVLEAFILEIHPGFCWCLLQTRAPDFSGVSLLTIPNLLLAILVFSLVSLSRCDKAELLSQNTENRMDARGVLAQRALLALLHLWERDELSSFLHPHRWERSDWYISPGHWSALAEPLGSACVLRTGGFCSPIGQMTPPYSKPRTLVLSRCVWPERVHLFAGAAVMVYHKL